MPDSVRDIYDDGEQAIDRAGSARSRKGPAGIRSPRPGARRREPRSFHSEIPGVSPAFNRSLRSAANAPWAYTTDLTGGLALSMNWTVFDGGAQKPAGAGGSRYQRRRAQVGATRDRIESEVWSAYSNLNTAFRQREAAIALLQAATSLMRPRLNLTAMVFVTYWM
jgi:hypothetical protein